MTLLLLLPACDARTATEGRGQRLPAEQWRVTETPTVIIGEDAVRPESQLAEVRSAEWTGDGFLVVNGRPPGLRLFDAQGAHLRTIVREGSGPGEFRMLYRAWVGDGDTLVAYDPALGRLTSFDREGALLDTRAYEMATGTDVGRATPNVVLGRFPDGSFLARPNSEYPWGEAPGDEGVVRRRPFALLRVSPDARTMDTIAVLPGAAYVFLGLLEGRPHWASPRHGPRTLTVAHDRLVFVSDTDAWIVRALDLHGREVRRYSRVGPKRPVTPGDWIRLREERVAATERAWRDSGRAMDETAERELRLIRRTFDDVPRPGFFPTHDELLVDAGGRVWMRHFTEVADADRVWSVFAPDGAFLGEVHTPAALRVTAIAEDRMLGLWRGPLDVESVREYRLTKP